MGALEWLGYRSKVLLLHMFGPAELDEDHDPVRQLKREHGDDETGPSAEDPAPPPRDG